MKALFYSLLTIIFLSVSALAEDVSIPTAKKLIDEKSVLVVDVRTPEEYAEGHIEGAKSVNFRGDNFEEEAAKLDREKPILIHCKSGGRSAKALKTFKKLGFKKVYHMNAGYDAWVASSTKK